MNNIWQPMCNATSEYDVLYCRLSKDDGESNKDSDSISHQKEILAAYAAKNGFDHPIFAVDDGFSGTNFQRPGWQMVLQEIENGNVRSIICKNKDRFGRDYLRVGLYMEMFRERGIRFIAINDGYDNSGEDDDFAPFRDIIAEFYARDTSKKIKAVLHSKGHSGKPLTNQALYGFRKDPDDHNHWLLDDTAVPIVQRIFQMTVEGKGPFQIAKILHDEQIIRPSCHIARLNDCVTAKSEQNPYNWTDATVTNIIHRPEYMGHTVNFRTYKTSFKSKKHKLNPPEKWEIFENTHDSIIDPLTWETAQKCRVVKRRTKKSDGQANPLTGLVYCGTCGGRMYNHRGTNYSETRPSQDSYCCNKYSQYPPQCTRHNISVKSLRELVLKAIRQVSLYVRENETEFITKLRADSEIQQAEAAKAQKKQLAADKRRVTELDKLIQQIYEDKVSKTLTEKRFAVLSKQYETEQETLEMRIAENERELAQFAEDSNRADKFIALVRKYTDFEELTPVMLQEYISKIVVHEAERPRGQRNQVVDIYLSYIGQFTPPGCEQTFPEYQSPEDKRKEYQRDYYQRNKDKILAECAERYAAKKDEKPEPPAKSAEEIAAEEAARREHHRAYQREYQREWRNKRRGHTEQPAPAMAMAQ
ncbi:recombinase [Clostridia bacterium]|nr:recombinase [Clostridia bacterium]